MRRVYDAARDDIELQRFRSVVRGAYQEAQELEVLYRDLPEVINGDRTATDNFRSILDAAAGRISIDQWQPNRREFSLEAKPTSVQARMPCDPTFFIRPDRIYYLTMGIERVAGGDREQNAIYRRTLHWLWRRTGALDGLLQLAHRANADMGRDRFAENLRLLTRWTDPVSSNHRHGRPQEDPLIGEGPGGLAPIGPGGPPDPMPPPGGEGPFPDGPPGLPNPPSFGGGYCDDLRDACKELIAEGIAGAPLLNSVSISGITSVSPAECTEDQAQITITGTGFGNAQPANIVVVIDYTVVEVESWSETEIVVLVPSDLQSGCVGLRDEDIEVQRRQLHALAQQAWDNLNTGLRCLEGVELPPNRLPYSPSKPACTDANFFAGTMPEIVRFLINGGRDILVARGTELILSWRVDNAEHIQITRTSDSGPNVDLVDPLGNIRSLGALNLETPEDEATYELRAWNGCGEVRQQVRARARTRANLQIVGIELIQVIQRFDPDDLANNNSVPLVARKNTVARVYLDPGLGPDAIRALEDVTGRIFIRPVNALPDAPPHETLRPFNERTLPNGNTVEGFMDVPPSGSSRSHLDQTLNFLLPFYLLPAGELEISVEAFVNGQRGDATWGVHAEQTMTAQFDQRLRQKIVPVLIRDKNLKIGPPDRQDVRMTLREIKTRLPMATDGFLEFFVNGNPFFTFDTEEDFTKTPPDDDPGDSWENLLDDFADFASDFPDNGEIWVGFLEDDPRYNTIRGISVFGRPYCVGRVNDLPLVMTHEFIHTFGVGHSQCGSFDVESQDPSLPVAVTEDMGIHPLKRQLYPAGTKDLMCGFIPEGTPAWPSIVLWQLMFNVFGWAGVP